MQDVNRPLTGTEPGLLAYWSFDDAHGCSDTTIDNFYSALIGLLSGGVSRVPSTVPNLGQQVVPNYGGNTGTVTVNIYGKFFEQGATVQLSKTGSNTVIADSVKVLSNGSQIQCKLNLSGKDTGVYNVSVLNPDTTVKFYPNSFNVCKRAHRV